MSYRCFFIYFSIFEVLRNYMVSSSFQRWGEFGKSYSKVFLKRELQKKNISCISYKLSPFLYRCVTSNFTVSKRFFFQESKLIYLIEYCVFRRQEEERVRYFLRVRNDIPTFKSTWNGGVEEDAWRMHVKIEVALLRSSSNIATR